MTKQRGFFPLIERKTPVLDRLRGNPEYKERPLLGILATSPGEIRSLRRGLVTGFGTALVVTLLLAPILARVPEK